MTAGDDETGRRRLAARRYNERVKLAAGFVNALTVGAIGAGVIIPAARVPPEFGPASLVWLAFGGVLHSVGHGLYALLRNED